jgi:uncharacterized protein (TIGR00369 family)
MSVTIDPTQAGLDRTRDRAHPGCIVCGSFATGGDALGLRCRLRPDGSVAAELRPGERFQGYPDRLHGGIIAALLDGTMTNCLFGHDVVAYTAELQVRFRHPVRTDRPVHLTARLERMTPPLYVLESELVQDGQVRATATGKFMQRPDGPNKTS